jgi:alkyl hydroperoxide reductase subunit AhpF
MLVPWMAAAARSTFVLNSIKSGLNSEPYEVLILYLTFSTAPVSSAIRIGKKGGITVDEHMRTSDPNIYAAGEQVH